MMKTNKIIFFNRISQKTSRLFERLHCPFLSRMIAIPRQKFCINFIKQRIPTSLNEIKITTYKNERKTIIQNEDYNVFVFWYQGCHNMPTIVKKCFDSIKLNFPSKKIVLISKDNLNEYIEIPKVIFEKVSSNKMSLTIFSDFLRVSLLYKYGGIWIDATVFLSKRLKDSVLSLPFFSLTHKTIKNEFRNLYQKSKGWSIYFMGSNIINHPLFLFIKNSYVEYFSKEDSIIDYFFTDYLISIFLSENDNFREEIEMNDIDGRNSYTLADMMNHPCNNKSISAYENLLDICSVHKLTYKRDWKEIVRNRKTVYSIFSINY